MAQLQITIDDGPEPVATVLEPLLDELDEVGVSAAFFVLGQEVQREPAATAEIVARGHVLGNHSWDHLSPRTSRYSDAEVVEQFRRTHDAVRRATGLGMRHWRAPRLEAIARIESLLMEGPSPLYSLSHCDIHADSDDSLGASDAAQMLRAIRRDLARHPRRMNARLLFHVRRETAVVIREVLETLVEEGHELVDFGQSW